MFDFQNEKQKFHSSSPEESLSDQNQKQEIKNEIQNPQLEGGQASPNFETREKLFRKGFTWQEQFQSSFTAMLSQTNFESMSMKLRYGNFELKINVIFTNLDEKIFERFQSQTGSFGVVRFCHFEGSDYAIKWVKFKLTTDNQIDLQNVYKEYFLCCMAGALEVGPQMSPLFGYDIVVSKSTAFFSMEKCFYFIKEPAAFETQLLQNLRLLHSAKFIHMDIKPQNIAYSKQMSKMFFIDFGLSTLIKQVKGQKTKTRFSGTLSYCSQEMRKCCILNKPMLVDLYENDYCCLQKSMKYLKNTKAETYGEEPEEYQPHQINFFQQLAFLIRMKFFIEQGDCQEVLKILNTPNRIFKSLYQILVNSNVPKSISQNIQIKDKKQQLRKKIYDLNQESFPTDNILSTFFSQGNQEVSASKIIPISQLLQLEKYSFQATLTKVQMVYKLFLFFDPFSKKNRTTLSDLNLKENLVLKIHQMTHPNLNRVTFFCEKLRSTLIFFYDNLKNLRKLKVMLSLRLLFISIQDWSYLKQLQDEIIQCIETPNLKILKIIQFSLFWDIILQDFNHKRKQKWKAMVKKMNQQSSFDEKELKLFHQLIGLNYENTPKESMLRRLIEFYQKLSESIEKQTIYTITFIYCERYKVQFSLFTSPPKGLTLKIYSRFFLLIKVQLDKTEEFEHKLLLPFCLQFERQFYLNQCKDLVLNALNHNFQFFKQPEQYINCLFLKYLKHGFIYKECLFFFLEKIKIIVQHTKVYLIDYCLFGHLMVLHLSFDMVRFNKQKAVATEKVSKEEERLLLDQIQSIFGKILSKEGSKNILQKSKQIKLQMMIVEALILLRKQISEKQKKIVLQTTALQLNPLPYKLPNFVVNFFYLFDYFQPNIVSKQDHFSKDALIKIVQTYIEQRHFYIFEGSMHILGLYIKIKNQRGENNTHQIILTLVNNFETGNHFYAEEMHNKTIISAIEIFRITLKPEKSLQVYDKIKLKQMEFTQGLYAFVVFQLFFVLFYLLSEQDRRKQIIRTALSLPKMPWICQKRVKPNLIRFCRLNNIFSSKRKEFIYYKLQAKLAESQIYKELKNKITRRSKQSTLEALTKAQNKLKKYNLSTSSKILAVIPLFQ